MKYLWASRFLAAVLVFGGAGGFVISTLTFTRLFHQDWIVTLSAAVFAVLYLAAVVIGVALWRNKNCGVTWAALLFALQIPVLSTPRLSYEWFTGIAIKYVGNGGSYSWSAELGGADNFHLQTSVADAIYGGNVFAVAALTYLLVARYRLIKKYRSDHG